MTCATHPIISFSFDNYFYRALDTQMHQQVYTSLKMSDASLSLDPSYYCDGINTLSDRWQYSVDFNGVYSDE